uniref:UMP-CMP kinase 2, mitochondrial n=1 Tax=Cacopsylla melanoneura TaxID=428564 RepID=A0A8D8V2P0_9HEMI
MSSKYQLFAQYPSLVSVLSILKSAQYSSLPEVEELLNIYSKISDDSKKIESGDNRKHPLIVLEGLDGCGKSHTSKLVAQKLKASLKSTPPPSIVALREKFDSQDGVLRRAYYSLGNYIAAHDIRQILHKQPVVMDRFWHSTAAYGMANTIISNSDLKLPDPDDELYNWPEDLLKPDLIIYLTVSEQIRLQRLSRRKTFTEEEAELKKNAKFREIINNIFRNMKNPEIVVVDNSEKNVHESSDDIVKMAKELPSYKHST